MSRLIKISADLCRNCGDVKYCRKFGNDTARKTLLYYTLINSDIKSIKDVKTGINLGFAYLRMDRFGYAEQALNIFCETNELLKTVKVTDKHKMLVQCGISYSIQPVENLASMRYHYIP